MTREQRLTMANAAMERAADLARDAELHARHSESRHRAQPLAAAGALWVAIARGHADIAVLLPEDAQEDTDV
ncbi:hypothetical protein [Streptomyces sp. NPDC096311]|uniref:hypothetical protein n=1 Tax=Streptomyces sp. NPDC096311 TaxID=3366083 RepID=UPI00380493DC